MIGCPLALSQRQRVAHPVAEERAVGEAGERIVERLVGELLLQPLPLAHVAGVEHDAAGPSGRAAGWWPGSRRGASEPSGWRKRHSTGPVTPGRLRRVARRSVAARSRSSGCSRSAIGRPHHLGRVVAEHPVGRRAHEPDGAVGAGHDDDVGGVLHQRAEPGLVLPRGVSRRGAARSPAPRGAAGSPPAPSPAARPKASPLTGSVHGRSAA